MKVLVIEAGCQPMVKEIDGSLKSMQEVVGAIFKRFTHGWKKWAGLQRGREDQRHGAESPIVG